jgi:hypothetical protein
MNRRAYLAVVAVGLVVGAVEYVLHYRGLAFPDALDYAQMARETARGRAFHTLITRPHTVATSGHNPFVDTSRPPLYPLVLGLWFCVFGAGEFEAASLSAIIWIAAGSALYAFARRFLDRGPAAVAGILFLLTARLLPYVWSGMSEAPFILLILLAFWQLSAPPGKTRHALAGGLLIAAACLVRTIGILVLPWALFLGWTLAARTRRARAVMASATVLPLAAWVLIERLVGAPTPMSFNLAQLPMFTDTYPRYSLFRIAAPVDVVAFLRTHPTEITAKFVGGLKVYAVGLLRLLPIPTTLAWMGGVLIPVHGQRSRCLRRAALGLIATHLAVLPFYEPTPRFLVPLAGFLVLLGVTEVCGIARTRTRTYLLAVWLMLSVASLRGWARSPALRPERFAAQEAAALGSAIDRNAVVITDAPWRTAWELGHESVWIPQDEASLRVVEQKLGNVGGFILTPALPAMVRAERPVLWMKVWTGAAWPEGYRRAARGLAPGIVVGRRITREPTR